MTTSSTSSMGSHFVGIDPQAPSGAMDPDLQSTQNNSNEMLVCPISCKPYEEIQVPVQIMNVKGILEPHIYEKEDLQTWRIHKNSSPTSRQQILRIVDCPVSQSQNVAVIGPEILEIVHSNEPQSQEAAAEYKFSQKILKGALKACIFALKVLGSIALTLTMTIGYTLIGAVCGILLPGALVGLIFGTYAGIRISQNVFWEGKDLLCDENKKIANFLSEN